MHVPDGAYRTRARTLEKGTNERASERASGWTDTMIGGCSMRLRGKKRADIKERKTEGGREADTTRTRTMHAHGFSTRVYLSHAHARTRANLYLIIGEDISRLTAAVFASGTERDSATTTMHLNACMYLWPTTHTLNLPFLLSKGRIPRRRRAEEFAPRVFDDRDAGIPREVALSAERL